MMETFINDFKIFFAAIFEMLGSLWGWLETTIIGEILIFVILIGIFIGFITIIINLKN